MGRRLCWPASFYLIGLECQKVHFISCKGRLHKMFSCVRLRHMDFLKIFREIYGNGRNRPLFAIRANIGLFGASMPRNFWKFIGILRKSHIPAKDNFVNILCNLPVKFYDYTFWHSKLYRKALRIFSCLQSKVFFV